MPGVTDRFTDSYAFRYTSSYSTLRSPFDEHVVAPGSLAFRKTSGQLVPLTCGNIGHSSD